MKLAIKPFKIKYEDITTFEDQFIGILLIDHYFQTNDATADDIRYAQISTSKQPPPLSPYPKTCRRSTLTP